ncbi:MAG: hypothetical protein II727_11040 [Oscillospiraceae bacterium]|nr:hypothetical protein [Oscillospiraceae bacterium]
MKKTMIFALVLLLLASLAGPALAFDAERSAQNLTVDGKAVSCDKYNIDGSNYFKLRDLAYLLNGTESQFDVGWNEEKGIVSITTKHAYTTSDGHELEIGADLSATAQRSAQTIQIDGAVRSGLTVYNIGGSNFFKLRDLGIALGFGVGYNAATNTAIVTSGESTPAASGARLGLTQDAGREYLDKIIFLGDSTTYGIGYYYDHGYTALCPRSQVWTPASGTLTLSDYATASIVYPETKESLSIEDAVKRAKPEIMVITLGVNGVSFMDEAWFVRDYTALVQMIQKASPDTKIILNTIYPIAASYKSQKSINNTKICAANGWIEQIAEDTGVRFLNSYECLVGSDGWLPESSQNGDGLHLNGEAFSTVMDYIRTHAYN